MLSKHREVRNYDMSLAQLTLIGLVVWTTDGVWFSLTKWMVNIMNFSELQWLSKARVLHFFITIRRDGSSLYRKRTVIYFEDTGWISILAFFDACGQVNGLRRKLKGKILLVCKLHSVCFIHIFWTTEFVGLQMPWKCCKNTSEGRSVYRTLNISSSHWQTGLRASVQNEVCLEYLLTFKRDFWRHLTCIFGPNWSSYSAVMNWWSFA
jgi:hypothetical protein